MDCHFIMDSFLHFTLASTTRLKSFKVTNMKRVRFGFGSLQTANDLWNKLEYDYRLIQDYSTDVYLFYNFFITAYHLVDWVNDGAEKNELEKIPEVNVAMHIANGSKHLFLSNPKNDSIKSTTSESYYVDGYYESDYYETVVYINFDDKYKTKFGSRMPAKHFAEKLMECWEGELRSRGIING